MRSASLLGLIAGSLFSGSIGMVNKRVRKYFTTFFNLTKSGPSRSREVKRKLLEPGSKIARKAFEGRIGLRGRTLSGASLMAQQGKLGFDSKGRRNSDL